MKTEPIAYARKWFVDGEKPQKVRDEKNRLVWPLKFKLLPVSTHKCLSDDVPLYSIDQLRGECSEVAT